MKKTYVQPWKQIADHQTIVDVVQRCFLVAFFAKESNVVTRREILRGQIAKAFTPTTNINKLENGVDTFHGLKRELITYSYSSFVWLVKRPLLQMKSDEALETIFRGDVILQKEFWDFVQINALSAIRSTFDLRQFKKRFYTYIFVDQENVDPIQQLVQASHVAMVIGKEMDDQFDAHNIHFQVVKVPNGTKITALLHDLVDNGFIVEAFYEPDVDRIIAIGTHPVRSDKRRFLVNYDLLEL